MRFLTGLLLGFGIGFALAVLFAPEGQRRRGEAPLEGKAAGPGRDEQDPLAALRRALRSLQEQAQEAWEEARQAAQEAEQEMRARYGRRVRRSSRAGGR